MNIVDSKITTLLSDIERVRRRKIADYKSVENVEYIDVADNMQKINIPNNNLIFGRRGSGKTTLILAAIKKDVNIITAIDIQPIKSESTINIILKILSKIMQSISDELKEEFVILEKQYLRQYEGITGIIYWLLKKRDKELKQKYIDEKNYLDLIEKEESLIEHLKRIQDEIEIEISEEKRNNHETTNREEYTSNFKTNANVDVNLQGKYKIVQSSINTSLSSITEYLEKRMDEVTTYNSSEMKTSYVKKVSRIEILQEQKENIAFLFNEVKKITEKGVVVYWDDFYQIPLENQPEIIQYFHDIYKLCNNYSFCFKIATLPNRLRMNENEKRDMSYKDDFSTIKLDFDLSELDRTREYLLKIIININTSLGLAKQDIEGLFSNAEVLLYAIIATGGNPRDFLLMFAEIIKNARQDNSKTIKKEHIYSVVKDLRADKDNNIETDFGCSTELIQEAIALIAKEIVEEKNTNVFLYPKALAEKHEYLLKNLVNLRYLHVIKDTISSESRKKEDFVAYLVDMSFYAVNKRLKQGFNFCQFWLRDSESRLTELRKAKIWNFPKSLIDKYSID